MSLPYRRKPLRHYCEIRIIISLFFLTGLYLLSPDGTWGYIKEPLTLPLPVHNLYPPMTRFLTLIPDSAFKKYDRKIRFNLFQHYTSIFQFDKLPDGNYLADMELYTVEFEVRKPFFKYFESSVILPIHRPFAGFMDGFLHNFHNALNLPNSGRELRPENQFAYRYKEPVSSEGWEGRKGWEIGNIILKMRYYLSGNRLDRALAALLAVKLPTASYERGWGTNSPDIGLGGLYSWRISKWFGNIEGLVIRPFSDKEAGISYRTYSRGMVSIGRSVTSKTALIAQIQGGSSPYRSGFSELDQPPYLVSLGLRRMTGRGGSWSLSFVENITQRTTPDFGITLGIEMP